MNTPLWDVIVIGGGPAGAATAGLLAQRELKTLVLEKLAFPRFQIGESLLPVCLPVLQRLGVEPNESTHLYKRGAEFVCEELGQQRVFDFSKALPGAPRHAWQVDRAGFDAALLARTLALGAELRSEERVTKLSFDAEGVEVRTDAHSHRARFVVDATGQNRLLARHFDSAEPFPGFGHAAAFCHFSGLSDAAMEKIGPGHDIRIMVEPEGWGWVIPLPHRRLSVGLVTREGRADQAFARYVERSQLIGSWTQGTQRSDTKLVRNFSFRNRAPYGVRYACVGDAACFLDPVFSSGVSLALVGADKLSERIAWGFQEGCEAEAQLCAPVGQAMEPAYMTFAAIIHRFYHTHFIRHFIFGDTRDSAIEPGVVSVLAGDVWRHDNPFQQMLLRARRRVAFPTLAQAQPVSRPVSVAAEGRA